eukprot:g5618.t1
MNSRASFFEADAAKKLASSLQAALTFSLRTLSDSFPRQARYLRRFEDEIVLLVSAMLESNSLLTHAASFSETLYGMTRTSTTNKPRPTSRQLVLSLSTLLVGPYIESKLSKIFEGIHRDGVDEMNNLSKVFHHLYPLGKLGFESLDILFQVLYIVGKTKYYSPILYLLGLELSTISPDQLRKDEKVKILKRLLAMDSIDRQVSLPWLNCVLKGALRSCYFVTDNLRNVLVFGIFAFKALEWWYLVGEDKLKEKSKLPVPPPPPAPSPHPDGIELPPNRPDLCPLCKAQRKNPTQLTVSGYVFCYSCAFDYINRHARCPVTRKQTDLSQLRRLFKGSSF